MMKSILLLALCLGLCTTYGQCDALSEACAKSISKQFIVDPNFFQTELNPQDLASIRAVWLKGNTYRLSICGSDTKPYIIMVYDEQGQLLFDNTQFDRAQVWDFFPENTMHVQVIIRPNEQSVDRSCVSVLTAFKK